MKSLFAKLTVAYIAIMLFTVFVIGLLLTQSFSQNYRQQYVSLLTRQSQILSDTLAEQPLAFRRQIQTMLGNFHASVWLVDDNGVVRFATNNDQNVLKKIKNNPLTDQQKKEIFDAGQTGDPYPIVKANNAYNAYFLSNVFTMIWPLDEEIAVVLTPASEQINVKTILVHLPAQAVNDELKNLYMQIILGTAIASVVGIGLIALVSARMTKPLREMNIIARDIAKGKFDHNIRVKGADEIAQLANSLNLMAKDIKNLEEMRKGFVANVSHELRSPMTSIQGFVQAMLDGTIATEEYPKYLEIVRSEIGRLSSLVNDLLSLSQIESGSFPMHLQDFDIHELIRMSMIHMEQKIANQAIQVELLMEDSAVVVHADKERIAQVLQNLLDNAIKYSPEKGILRVGTQMDHKKVTVFVQDEGPGIKSEDLSHIWDRFYTGEMARTPGKGVGLGLSIVKSIIEQHHEQIEVMSDTGKGSKFSFTLTRSTSFS